MYPVRSGPCWALIDKKNGPPDILRLEIERPTPKDKEVLVKIHATTVNRTDCGFRRAEPFIAHFFSGVIRPRNPVLGSELAGEVEAVGTGVTLFEAGDDVFDVNAGDFGAHPEFVCMSEDAPLAKKPTNMTFEEAAAVCDRAILALSYLRRADLRKGQRILIYGASGSIGTAAVQLAKNFDADVTAVCNTKNVETMRSLGADKVLDYTQEDFTKNGGPYDVNFDAVGKSSFRRCKDSLKQCGIYLGTDLGLMLAEPDVGFADHADWNQESGIPDAPIHEEGRTFSQGSHRGGEVQSGHRSVLPLRANHRRNQVRRNGAEDGKRRLDHRPRSQ